MTTKRNHYFIGSVYSMTFGRIDCYEDAVFGDEAPIIIKAQRNAKLATEWLGDCWELGTVHELAEEEDARHIFGARA